MSHRALLGSVALSLIAGCGSTVIVTDEDEGGGGSGGTGSAVTSTTQGPVGPGPVTGTTVGPSTATATSVSSANVTTASGPFGDADLFPQDLGPINDDRNVFTLADNAIGAHVTARTPSPFGEAVLSRLVAPSGSVVFDGPLPQNGSEFYGYGAVSMVIPQVQHPESFPVAPGTWSVQVRQTSDQTTLTALERRTVDGEFHGGVIDVNVFLVPGVSDADYLLSQIENGFSGYAGLELGDVRFFDASDSFYEINDNNYFDAQQSTASAPIGQAVTLLVVGYINFIDAPGVLGFSPGAPADPVSHGSSSSTLVWMAQNDGFFDEIIVRHEAGHYAGLHHTSEYEPPGLNDPLDDTPNCEDVLTQFESCPDYDNVMFPSGGSGANLLTASQIAVIRGSAIYRGIFAEGQYPAAPLQDLRVDPIASARTRATASSTVLDGRGSRPSAPLAGPTPRSLRASLPAEVAALDGIGCGNGGSIVTLIDQAAQSVTARELVDVAMDRHASPPLRHRALLAASKARGGSEVVTDLVAIARDGSTPELVRAGAIRALGTVAPAEREVIAPALRADASRLVRHMAR